MKISDLERLLAKRREELGDVEIKEATTEYGWIPFTEKSLDTFVRLETSTARGSREGEKHLVIGRH